MLRVCGITMKVISLWATRIRWLFSFYLPIFLLWLYRRVLWRLQKVRSFFLSALFSWYLHRLFEKVETILIGNFHFFIKTQDKRQTLGLSSPISLITFECAFKCLEKDPCLSFNLADLDDNIDNLLCELLPSDHYTHSDKFITNHLWYHYSIAVKLFSFFYFILSSRVLLLLLLFHPNYN